MSAFESFRKHLFITHGDRGVEEDREKQERKERIYSVVIIPMRASADQVQEESPSLSPLAHTRVQTVRVTWVLKAACF